MRNWEIGKSSEFLSRNHKFRNGRSGYEAAASSRNRATRIVQFEICSFGLKIQGLSDFTFPSGLYAVDIHRMPSYFGELGA